MPLKSSTLITIGVFLLAYAGFASLEPGMWSLRVASNLMTDSAYLGILAVGMLVVIASGGIDLSVGAVMAFTALFIAVAITHWGVPPLVAFALALAGGASFGALIGATIRWLDAPPFIVTLMAMFLARGSAIVLSQESVPVRHDMYAAIAAVRLPLGDGGAVSPYALIMLATFVLGGIFLHRTRFGTTVFAAGGDKRAAELMGAPLGRATVLVYAFSGAMAALAGIVFSLYTQAGYALSAVGVELEAIAAVVIGGALLAGGSGSMIGAFFGVMIQALIQTYLTFNGALSSWWQKIAIGLLIFAFLIVQKVSQRTITSR